MKRFSCWLIGAALVACVAGLSWVLCGSVAGAAPEGANILIPGDGPGWRALGEADFENVNCDPDTWSFKDGTIC